MSNSAVRDLALAADDNLATHFSWVQRHRDDMHFDASHGVVMIDCGMPCDTFNAVCRSRLGVDQAPARVGEIVDWFRARNHPFSWWVGPADQPEELGRAPALRSRGYHPWRRCSTGDSRPRRGKSCKDPQKAFGRREKSCTSP